MRFEHVQQIAAPISVVWDLTVDVEAWPSFTSTMTSVRRESDGPLSVGEEVICKQPRQPTRKWTVTELSAPSRFAWSTKALGMTLTGTHALEAADGGTLNRLLIDVEGRVAPVLGRLMKRPMLKAMAAENEDFRRRAEGEQR